MELYVPALPVPRRAPSSSAAQSSVPKLELLPTGNVVTFSTFARGLFFPFLTPKKKFIESGAWLVY